MTASPSNKTTSTQPGRPLGHSRSVRYSRQQNRQLEAILAHKNKEHTGPPLKISDLLREAIDLYIQQNEDLTSSPRTLKRSIHNYVQAIDQKLDDVLTTFGAPADLEVSPTVLHFLQLIHLYTLSILHLQANTLVPLLHKTGSTPPTPQAILEAVVKQAWTDQTMPALVAALFNEEHTP